MGRSALELRPERPVFRDEARLPELLIIFPMAFSMLKYVETADGEASQFGEKATCAYV